MAGPAVPPATRATRLAGNAALVAVGLFGLTYLATTQVPSIRAGLPFTEDPYDGVVSIAVLLLPLVVGTTWARSVRQRGPAGIPQVVRVRIEVGVGLALGLVLAAVGAQLAAVAVVGAPDAAPPVLALVTITGVTALAAFALLVRAWRSESSAPAERAEPRPEPDTLDDLVALGRDGASLLGRIAPAAGRVLERASGWLDAVATAPLGPRRHRSSWIAVASAGAAVGAVAWHALLEGAWANPWAAAVFGAIAGLIALVGLGLLGPLLRIVRPA